MNWYLSLSLSHCVQSSYVYTYMHTEYSIGNINGVFIIIIYFKYDLMSCKTAAVWFFCLSI